MITWMTLALMTVGSVDSLGSTPALAVYGLAPVFLYVLPAIVFMYVLMFIAAMRLRRSQPDQPRVYRAPALGLLCLFGGTSSVAALVIGFVPPSQFGHSNPLTYAVWILAGILAIGILPPPLMDRLRKPGWKATCERFHRSALGGSRVTSARSC